MTTPTRWTTLASSVTTAEPVRVDENTPLEEETGQLLLFDLAGRVYACEVAPVREIVPFKRATRLPGAPPYVLGLINLRGSIVTVLDLGRRLGVTETVRERGSVIFVESGQKCVGLAVDSVRDVHRAGEAQFEAPLASMPEGAAVRGVGQVAGVVVILLDVEAIVRNALV